MSTSAFERYAPFIREYIYRKRWTDLREVQVEACNAILDTEDHVIVASGTASGKTEAAFFPILTSLYNHPSSSISVIYIGPLKALINDQFERLGALLDDQGIPVWPWHGDVSQSMKKRAMKECQGVLQITPESLEAILMCHTKEVSQLFSDLRFVVIDEIHALMGTDRGLQVLCLLTRLERMANCSPRRVGLSATLNDYEPAMEFISAGTKRLVQTVGISNQKRKISLCVENFVAFEEEISEEGDSTSKEMNEFLYQNTSNKKCLIFTNSRGNAEKIIADLKEIATQRKEPDIFYVHHGSLSAEMRHEAEVALRDNAGPTVAAATLTLEMGIDIGDLDSTVQVGAPYSCSSFVQRLGRSGRRSGISQMMFVNLEAGKDNDELFPWNLLRSIAIIQLYIEERWVEPFELKQKPFSLLVHQTLSTLMTNGEMAPSELARQVLTLPAFRDTVTQEEYKELLRFLIQKDYLLRMDHSGIIIGTMGEKFTNHYTFYSVFQAEEAYHVFHKEHEVGMMQECPTVGDSFLLAAHTWRVVEIDELKRKIYVVPAANTKAPNWKGTVGNIHSRIIQRMRQVLLEDTKYAYLRPNAAIRLEEARKEARSLGILEQAITSAGGHTFEIYPWVGTKQIRTMKQLFLYGLKDCLKIQSVKNSELSIQVTSDFSMEEFRNALHEISLESEEPCIALPEKEVPRIDKYDFMVPDDLIRKAYIFNELDLKGTLEVLHIISGMTK